jgi:glycosyltransferase involved in cell wall biosynthesis
MVGKAQGEIRKMEGGLWQTGMRKETAAKRPLISVVTVVFNGEAHLEETIVSVLRQDYDNIEYLIVDGGSTDGTLDILEKYADRIDYWVSEPDGGIYDAMNKGLKLAGGELIGLLNADDFYQPGALEKVAESYRKEGVQGIYYGDNFVLQEDLGLKYRFRATLRYWLGMPMCHQAMFVHRDVYAKLGGYSTSYRFAGDYDFLLRAVAANTGFVHVSRYLVSYRNTGLTSAHYTSSLAEAKRINRAYCGALSRRHFAYLLSYGKTLTLHFLQKILLVLCGEKVLNRFRLLYMKKIIVKKDDVIED